MVEWTVWRVLWSVRLREGFDESNPYVSRAKFSNLEIRDTTGCDSRASVEGRLQQGMSDAKRRLKPAAALVKTMVKVSFVVRVFKPRTTPLCVRARALSRGGPQA